MAWTQKSYPVDPGIHILKWRFIKNSSGSSGDNCGWVDFVQWTGPAPTQDPANWQEIAYKQDVTGRRVEKKVDGYSTRYVYDGDQVVAEYDGNNNLLRKYIYGPGIDQPISMTEVADANATYYYHFDALGSVVALSNASGDTVQTYQYSVYGEVAVEDPNHTNPYMFTGRSFDVEIGLYYYRARYYNPFTGRFLQADPIGYEAGMNLYRYCANNPLNRVDPYGLEDSNCLQERLDFEAALAAWEAAYAAKMTAIENYYDALGEWQKAEKDLHLAIEDLYDAQTRAAWAGAAFLGTVQAAALVCGTGVLAGPGGWVACGLALVGVAATGAIWADTIKDVSKAQRRLDLALADRDAKGEKASKAAIARGNAENVFREADRALYVTAFNYAECMQRMRNQE